MEDTLSPVPDTTAEEAMSSSWDIRASARESGPTEGSVPLRSTMAAEAVDEEPVRDSEAWAVTVPPVKTHFLCPYAVYVFNSHVFTIPVAPCNQYMPVQCSNSVGISSHEPNLYYGPVSASQEWVPIIRHDLITQRKMKTQPPMSDAYLHGMPAKRRKVKLIR